MIWLVTSLSISSFGYTNSLPASLIAQNFASDETLLLKLTEGRHLREAGEYAAAERVFRVAAEQAQRAGAKTLQAQALLLASGCQIHRHRYGEALKTLDTANEIAVAGNEATLLGAIASNSSSIYFALGDMLLAEQKSEQSVAHLRKSQRQDYLANALILNGNIKFALGHASQGKAALTQAIDISKAANLLTSEAFAENELSAWLILNNNLNDAGSLLQRSLTLSRTTHDGYGLAETSAHLSELKFKQGGRELKAALSDIDSALSTTNERFKSEPQQYLIHLRGEILLGLGRKDQALIEFRKAVQLADTWRQGALAGDATNIRTVAQLESVYRDFAHLAAELSLERDDHALAREAFEVLARNRASSLREQLTRSYSGKLLNSPEYFDLLQQLQTAQAAATLNQDPAQVEADREKLSSLRAHLSDLENHIGFNQQNVAQLSEIKGSRTSLKSIQARLSENEALLSFSLGERKSFLWAVTKEDLRLYDLPRQEIIAGQASAFSRAVSENSEARVEAGRALSHSLFSNIAPSLKRKSNWLLTPDGALLDKIPFSSLPTTFEGNEKPLNASHSLRILPSPLLLRSTRPTESGERFVGVADPVYNLADSRRDRSGNKPVLYKKVSSTTLARLVGSEREVRVSGEKCGLPQIKILTGYAASGAELRRQIQPPPAILHFAVHVLSPKDFPQEAALALSLNKDNLPELLTAESVATFRIPGSLVVLSGCASQQGEVLPGAGLIGLSRGWLLAGAAAVIVSAWPTPDDSGQFFSSFYGHFRQTSGSVGSRAATALQKTQLDMQRGGGYRSEPKFWAAYSVISKE